MTCANNGTLPGSVLAPVWTGRDARLHIGSAASSLNTMNLFLFHERPSVGRYQSNGPMSDYRTIAQQWYLRNDWCSRGACGNAAYPGTSNHGCAKASDGQRWKMLQYKVFNWYHSDAPWESWHSLHGGGWEDRPDPGPDPHYPVLRVGSGGIGQILHVKRLQSSLAKLGIFKVPVSGTFGPLTKEAVLEFQRKAGWNTPTGICTRATWIAIAVRVKNGGM